MFIEGDHVQLLSEIGFTKNQAKVYLTLLKLEEATGKTLSERIDIPRPEVYRILGELQKKGLVEKEITTPYKFRATPIDLGLQILVSQRIQRCKEIQVKAEDFLQKLQNVKPSKLIMRVC